VNKKATGSLEPIPGRCGAKLRGTDPPRYCKRFPMKGKSRCRRCGGKTPSGTACVNTKHGLYSQELPVNLRARYEAILEDKTLTDLLPLIGLAQLRVSDLLGKLKGEVAWDTLASVLASRRQALADDDEEAAQEALEQLEAAIDSGPEIQGTDEATWDKLNTAIEKTAGLIDKYNTTLYRSKQVLTPQQAMLLRAFMDEAVEYSVREHIHDEATCRAIFETFGRFCAGILADRARKLLPGESATSTG